MEDTCILCNVILKFFYEKNDQGRKTKALRPFQVPNDISTIM